MSGWYDREEAAIHDAHARGEISNAEMWKQLRDLQREYRDAADEAAQDAADRERERW